MLCVGALVPAASGLQIYSAAATTQSMQRVAFFLLCAGRIRRLVPGCVTTCLKMHGSRLFEAAEHLYVTRRILAEIDARPPKPISRHNERHLRRGREEWYAPASAFGTGFCGQQSRVFGASRRPFWGHDTAFRPLVHQFHCSLREDCIAACCKDLPKQPVCSKTLSTRHQCN